MPRYNTYQDLDEQPVGAGDQGFRGVNMRMSPERLEPGILSEAINCRFFSGIVETRRGAAFLPWCHKITFGVAEPWGRTYGIGSYRDPRSGRHFQITAADGNIYGAFENNGQFLIPLPVGVTILTPVTFEQCFNVLIMFRGKDLAPLVMDDIDFGFHTIVQTVDGDGTSAIPNAERGAFFSNRLIIPFGNDEVAVSDILDYTRYVPTLSTFRINQGSIDKLVSVVKFNDTTLVAFKAHSIFAILNVVGDLSTTQLDEITAEYGLIAPRSTVHVGNDLWFLSQFGVMSLKQTEQNKLQGVTKPISDEMDPVFKRLNWRYAYNAVACYNDNKFYIAIPLDEAEVLFDELWPNRLSAGVDIIPTIIGENYRWVLGINETSLVNGAETYTQSLDFVATAASITINGTLGEPFTGSLKRVLKGVNNTLLVYDLLQQAWSGRDETPEMDYKDLFVQPVHGQDRMFIVTSTGHVLMYEETVDDWRTVPALDLYTREIRMSFKTRGFTVENLRLWTVMWLGIDLRTWRPNYSINLIHEGAFETATVTQNVTKSTTRYSTINRPEWDPTNVNDDFDTPKREDYSVTLGLLGTIMAWDGIEPEIHQEAREMKAIDPRIGKAPQIEFINTQGRVRVLSAALEGRSHYPRAGNQV